MPEAGGEEQLTFAERTELLSQEARIAGAAASRDADQVRDLVRWEAEARLSELYHGTVTEVSRSAIDRARSGAEFVEKAALSIGSLYAGLLGLVFSVTDRPLPVRGVLAPFFLGIAIVAAAAYLAALQQGRSMPGRRPGGTLSETQENRTWFLARWMAHGVVSKRYTARVAVLGLMFGLVFLPAPFLGPAESHPRNAEPPRPDQAIEDDRLRAERFTVDLDIYREQQLSAANGDAETADSPPDDRGHDVAWSGAAVVAGLVTVGGPFAYGRRERRRAIGG